ncbi:MAG: hypothetical protein ACUVXI_01160 [bacterium]
MLKTEFSVGEEFRGRRIEGVGRMYALVYFCRGSFEVVKDRPIICTEDDIIGRVDMVHRCGTDVKIHSQGRPDQLDERLLEQLRDLLGLSGDFDPRKLPIYVGLLRDGERGECSDPLYRNLLGYVDSIPPEDRGKLWTALKMRWGRILGHEMVVTIVKVGSKVRELTEGIGYREGEILEPEYLDFRVGDRCVVQSRIARYRPPLVPRMDGVRGVQLLGGNITDLAMNINSGYAQYVRFTPEIVRSGSLLRVPGGISDEEAAMVEPAACLLDCFEKSTHELAQGPRGSVLKKGVLPGGVVAVIGSGSMAIMAGMISLMKDEMIEVGGAGEVVFLVRSHHKAELISSIIRDARVKFVITPPGRSDEEALTSIREQYAEDYKRRRGEDFRGFDDVIVAAGGKETIGLAHKIVAPTGARVLAFAGTRGEIPMESGFWHYGNAGTSGTSGCNTKMMEIVLGLLQRRSLSLGKLSGKSYTFEDLIEGIETFFNDTHLRPKLLPNEGLPQVDW